MSSIKVPDTISKLDPADTYPVVEGADVGGFTSLETKVNEHETKITKNIDSIIEVERVGSTFTYSGKVAPTYPSTPYGNYLLVFRAMPSTLDVIMPNPTGGMLDGAIFTLYNDDPTDNIKLHSIDDRQLLGIATMVNIPPENFVSFVYRLSSNTYIELETGYIPAAKFNLISLIRQQIELDGYLKGIQVEDGDGNYVATAKKMTINGAKVSTGTSGEAVVDIASVTGSGITLINPDGTEHKDIDKVKLVGMELKISSDGTPPKLLLLNDQNVPLPSTTSAYAFFDASATTPNTVDFHSLPLYRDGRVTLHKDVPDPQYAYIILPPGEGTDVDRVGEFGGLPAYWSKESKDYDIGGQQRTYTVFKSPYPFHETDITLILYP